MRLRLPAEIRLALPSRLSSRKWWLAVGTVVWLGVFHAWPELVQVTLGYFAVQGAADAVKAYRSTGD